MRPRWILALLIAVLVLPLAVAAVALRQPTWFPVLDLAMTELRLRDVFTSHSPLIGLPGRIGRFPEQGSHPGPMSFYALWPTWKLLGSTAWGMQVGALLLNGVAAATAVLIAFRRGGLRLAIAVTALLALLMSGYGISTLAEPWNPYLPLLWWLVTMLAVWSVLADDVAMLPIAVVAASMAAQTHVPYLGLCLGMGALAIGALAWQSRGSLDRARIIRWGSMSLVLAVVLWSPLVVDQATEHPGNLSMLYDHFTSPPEEEGRPVGLTRGIELQLQHLNVGDFLYERGGSLGSLAKSSGDAGGAIVPGAVVLVVWLVSAAIAWRKRHALLTRLNIVVATGLLVGVFSMSRIFGKVWYYLMLWSWGTVALLALSVGWTVCVLLDRPKLEGVGLTALVAAAVLSSSVLVVDAADADPPAPQLSEVLANVVPATARALDKNQRYLVTWDDSFYIGSQGYGLVSDLERRGFHVGVPNTWRVPVTQHRVFDIADVDAEVHLAVGRFVDLWRSVPSAQEVAFDDPRSPSERREYAQLREDVIHDLMVAGLRDDIELVDGNLFGLSLDERLTRRTRRSIEQMLDLGSPGAVFLVPPGTTIPPLS